MRKLLIVNALIFVLGFTFIIGNANIYDFIYFPVMQSAFTRVWFLKAFVVSLFICIILIIVIRYLYKSIRETNMKRIIDYELVLLYFSGLLISIHYIYIVLYPTRYLNGILIEILVYYEDHTQFIIWYIFEALVILLLLIKKIIRIKKVIIQNI